MQASNHSRAAALHNLPVEQLSTEELEQLLRAQDQQDPDVELICKIMEVIQEREADQPQPDVDAAWKSFLQDYQGQAQCYTKDTTPITPISRNRSRRRPVLRVLAIGLAAALLLCGTAFASGENLFQIVASWTNETLWFVAQREQVESQSREYGIFEELYEIVSGYTDTPVVPTWAPDGTEQLGDIKVTIRSNSVGILGTFQCSENQFTISIKVFDSTPTFDKNTYEKDGYNIYTYEIDGQIHYILKNNEQYGAVWINETSIVFIQGSIDKKTVIDIISSIYME